MSRTITITLSENRAKILREAAARYNVSLEEYVVRTLEEQVALEDAAGEELSPEYVETDEIDPIVDYLMAKNAELYRRLA